MSDNLFEDAEVISSYTLREAVEDGTLVEIFRNRWPELSGGIPIVATDHLFGEFSLAALMEVWNEFVTWAKTVAPTLPAEEHLFPSTMYSMKVWVIFDGEAFTMMFPEDY